MPQSKMEEYSMGLLTQNSNYQLIYYLILITFIHKNGVFLIDSSVNNLLIDQIIVISKGK